VTKDAKPIGSIGLLEVPRQQAVEGPEDALWIEAGKAERNQPVGAVTEAIKLS
jgi:hypothetical protein